MVRRIDNLSPEFKLVAQGIDRHKEAMREGRKFSQNNTNVRLPAAEIAHDVYLRCKMERAFNGSITHKQFTSASKVLFKLSQSNVKATPKIFKEFVRIALLNVTPISGKGSAEKAKVKPPVDRSTKPKKRGPVVDRSTKPSAQRQAEIMREAARDGMRAVEDRIKALGGFDYAWGGPKKS